MLKVRGSLVFHARVKQKVMEILTGGSQLLLP